MRIQAISRWLSLALVITHPSVGQAHGVTFDLQGDGDARLAFHYSDGTPMAGATYRVFAPSGSFPDASGITDAGGVVAFHAAPDGRWHVDVSDTNDHAARAWISVTHGLPAVAGQTIPDWFAALSLFLNILFGLQLVLRHRSRRAKTPNFPMKNGSIAR